MARWPDGQPVPLSQLGSLPRAAAGARGAEGAVTTSPVTSLLVKRYSRPLPQHEASALQEMIEVRLAAAGRNRKVIDNATSWPRHRIVTPGGATVGVLIPPAPGRYRYRFEGKPELREAQHLAHPQSSQVVGPITFAARMSILTGLCEILHVLDDLRLVHGDLQGRNWLFCGGWRWPAYLLDCDGIRPEYHPGARPKGNLAWSDPWLQIDPNMPLTRHTDRGLLALWILRTLAVAPVTIDLRAPLSVRGYGWPLASMPGLRQMLARGLHAPGRRPDPREWSYALADIARNRDPQPDQAGDGPPQPTLHQRMQACLRNPKHGQPLWTPV